MTHPLEPIIKCRKTWPGDSHAHQKVEIFACLLPTAKNEIEVYTIDAIIHIAAISLNGFTIIVDSQFVHFPLAFHTASCRIGKSTVRILVDQSIDLVHRLCEPIILLVQQRQPQLRFKVARHQCEQMLIIKAGEMVTVEPLIDISPIIEGCDIGGLKTQCFVVFILGISPFAQLQVP